MTDPDTDTTVSAPDDVPPMSSSEAAKIVEEDPDLQKSASGTDDPHYDSDSD